MFNIKQVCVMKSFIYIIIVLISTFNIIIAQEVIMESVVPVIVQDLELVAEIPVNTQELVNNVVNRKTQFEFRSKQKTDFVTTMYVQDIIKPHLKVPASEYNRLVVVFENPQGQSVVAGYSEFDPLLTVVPAVLVAKHDVQKKSKVVLSDDELDVDMSEVEALFAGDGPKLKIGLQIKTIPLADKEKMELDATIIFPKDLNTDRWINNIDVIKIYKYIPKRTPVAPVVEEKKEEPIKTTKTKKKK